MVRQLAYGTDNNMIFRVILDYGTTLEILLISCCHLSPTTIDPIIFDRLRFMVLKAIIDSDGIDDLLIFISTQSDVALRCNILRYCIAGWDWVVSEFPTSDFSSMLIGLQ